MVEKFDKNLADAVAGIQAQLDQLIAELGEMKAEPQVDRAKSISNALKEIAPDED